MGAKQECVRERRFQPNRDEKMQDAIIALFFLECPSDGQVRS